MNALGDADRPQLDEKNRIIRDLQRRLHEYREKAENEAQGLREEVKMLTEGHYHLSMEQSIVNDEIQKAPEGDETFVEQECTIQLEEEVVILKGKLEETIPDLAEARQKARAQRSEELLKHSSKVEDMTKDLKEARGNLKDLQRNHTNLEAMREAQKLENRTKTNTIIDLKKSNEGLSLEAQRQSERAGRLAVRVGEVEGNLDVAKALLRGRTFADHKNGEVKIPDRNDIDDQDEADDEDADGDYDKEEEEEESQEEEFQSLASQLQSWHKKSPVVIEACSSRSVPEQGGIGDLRDSNGRATQLSPPKLTAANLEAQSDRMIATPHKQAPLPEMYRMDVGHDRATPPKRNAASNSVRTPDLAAAMMEDFKKVMREQSAKAEELHNQSRSEMQALSAVVAELQQKDKKPTLQHLRDKEALENQDLSDLEDKSHSEKKSCCPDHRLDDCCCCW